MPRGVTEFSQTAYDLHMLILWICVVIGVLVFGAMFVSIMLHRKSKGVEAAQFTHSTKAEIAWTAIPILILILMAVPATRALILMETSEGAEMDIKVTGYQWKWKYEYMDTGVSFISSLAQDSDIARQLGSGINPATVDNYLLEVDNALVVPTDTKIRLLLTSGDVIHSWWVPELGWKRDAIPGTVNTAWTSIKEPGTYRGQCAELCGKDHGFMPVVVIAKPKAEFQQWLAQQPGYTGDDDIATLAEARKDDVTASPEVALAD
jgi:cytochrome c oxidase subunit 2